MPRFSLYPFPPARVYYRTDKGQESGRLHLETTHTMRGRAKNVVQNHRGTFTYIMDQEVTPITISLSEIAIRCASFQEPDRDVEGYAGTFNLTRQVAVEPDNSRIRLRLILQAFFEHPDHPDQDRVGLGVLDVVYLYQVEGMQSFERTATQVRVPEDISAQILFDAYLTTRGIWYARSVGMTASTAVLPFTNPRKLLHMMMEMEQEALAQAQAQAGAR